MWNTFCVPYLWWPGGSRGNISWFWELEISKIDSTFGMLHMILGLCHSTGIFVLVRYLGFKVVSVVQNWPLSYSPILCHFFYLCSRFSFWTRRRDGVTYISPRDRRHLRAEFPPFCRRCTCLSATNVHLAVHSAHCTVCLCKTPLCRIIAVPNAFWL